MSIFFPIVASTILGVVGQLVLKTGMTKMGALSLRGQSPLKLLLKIGLNPYVIGGLVIYATGVFFWLIALSRAPLSYAYPFASLSYVVITIASYFLLKERFGLLRMAGVLVICSGVLVVAFS